MIFEQFIDKYSYSQVDSNRYLRLLRELDRMQQALQDHLLPLRASLLERARAGEAKSLLEPALAEVTSLERQLQDLSTQKIAVVAQLSELVREPKEEAERELRKINGEERKEVDLRKKKKAEIRKRQQFQEVSEWTYDRVQPKFCYCGSTSSGQMVCCENPYCEREWFHTVCLDEKNIPEIWYCRDCRRLKEKAKNGLARLYL